MKWKLGLYRGYSIFRPITGLSCTQFGSLWFLLQLATSTQTANTVMTVANYCSNKVGLSNRGRMLPIMGSGSRFGVHCDMTLTAGPFIKFQAIIPWEMSFPPLMLGVLFITMLLMNRPKKRTGPGTGFFFLTTELVFSHTNSRTPLGSKSPVCSSRLQWCQITANRLWLPVAIS